MITGPHTLVTGKTDCGKSEIVKRLIRESFRPSGQYRKIFVLDPKKDPGFLGDVSTKDPAEFLRLAKTHTDCLLIVDESGSMVGRYGGAMVEIATMHRGLGHAAFFISQRPATLDKTIRENCSNLFTFKLGLSDVKTLQENFPDLSNFAADIPKLAQGEYIFCPSFGEPKRGTAW